MLDLLNSASISPGSSALVMAYASLLALVISGLIAWTYGATFHGLSYSRNYVQTLILVSLVASTVMQAIGDSIARGLGMMGALAVVRFRTTLTDPKDLVFLFAAIGSGIACGIGAWSTGAIGGILFCVTAGILYRADVGHRSAYDGLLRFTSSAEAGHKPALEAAFRKHLRHFALISLREVAGGLSLDHAYQIKLRRGHEPATLLSELSSIPSMAGLHFMMQESTTEL